MGAIPIARTWGLCSPRQQESQAARVLGFSVLVGLLREWRFRFSPLPRSRNQQRSAEHVELGWSGRIGLQAQEAMTDRLWSQGGLPGRSSPVVMRRRIYLELNDLMI